jgi:hypothetical protein
MLFDFRSKDGEYRMTKNFLARTFGLHSDNPKSKTCPELCRRIQNLKWLGLSAIAFVLVVTGAVAQAQQPTKVPRIGMLVSGSATTITPVTKLFARPALEYGKNIVIEYHMPRKT